MSRWRNGGVFLALILSQSCWLFLISGILGAMTQRDGAVLWWPSLLGLLFVSAGLVRVLSVSALSPRQVQLIGLTTGLALLYVVIALQYDGDWPFRFRDRAEGPEETARLGLAFALALFVWWRGARLGITTDPEGALRLWFRMGLIILVLAALIDVGYDVGLDVGIVAFPFFASSLTGLALLTLDTDDQQAQTRWGRVLVTSIGGALAVGAIVSLAVGGVLSGAATEFFQGLGFVARYVAIGVFFVIEGILRGIFWAIGAIGRVFTDVDVFEALRIPDFLARRPTTAEEVEKVGGAWAVVGAMVKWGLLALLVLGILLFLLWLFRKREKTLAEDQNEVRESIRSEVDDEDNLLGAILPKGHGKGHLALYPLPEGTDPLARLYRAYFHALNTAQERGEPRRPSETPGEYAPRLATVVPGTHADELSRTFARARYGGWTPPMELVARLEPNGQAGHQ
ncbi:MAG: DUF4129 domain-containing protein [Dehalococcoidia bacterium]|nr:DUF4129 domain-containing protein [Dehalococcoidia bacterium]